MRLVTKAASQIFSISSPLAFAFISAVPLSINV